MNKCRFSDTFSCYSCGYCDKPELEETGQILLPEDVLNNIYNSGYEGDGVMLFCIKNIRHGTELYAGVQTFTMTQGQVCLPYWMMQFLQCSEGDRLNISFAYLPKATRAIFQPLDSNFFDIPNPRVVLEYTLRKHPALTQSTVLNIPFNNKTYKLKVLKTEPRNAVQTLHADVICDFATPINKFVHHWNEPDTDSSDDGSDQPTVIKGHKLKGTEVEIVEEKKPLHSTFAQREEERLRGNVFRTKEIVAGQEILPPKPKEKKKEAKIDYFQGAGQILKPKKSKGKSSGKKSGSMSASSSEQSIAQDQPKPKEEPPKPKFTFTGVGKTLGGLSVMAEAPQQPKKPSQPVEQKPEPPKKDYFAGASQSVKGSVLQDKSKQPNTPPQPKIQPPMPQQQPSNPSDKPKINYFQGGGRKLK